MAKENCNSWTAAFISVSLRIMFLREEGHSSMSTRISTKDNSTRERNTEEAATILARELLLMECGNATVK